MRTIARVTFGYDTSTALVGGYPAGRNDGIIRIPQGVTDGAVVFGPKTVGADDLWTAANIGFEAALSDDADATWYPVYDAAGNRALITNIDTDNPKSYKLPEDVFNHCFIRLRSLDTASGAARTQIPEIPLVPEDPGPPVVPEVPAVHLDVALVVTLVDPAL